MKRWSNSITLHRMSLLIDFLLIACITAIFGKIYLDFENNLLEQKEREHRTLIQNVNEVINNFIVREIRQLQIIIPFLQEDALAVAQNTAVFQEMQSLQALYSVNEQMFMQDMFFYRNGTTYFSAVDLSASKIASYIKQARASQQDVIITPVHTSVMTGKRSIGFVFPYRLGTLVAELDLNGIFISLSSAGLLNLYTDALILLLSPDTHEVMYRSAPELYPYGAFAPQEENRVMIHDERYYYDRHMLKDLNIQLAVLTPEKYYYGSFNIIKKYLIVLVVLVIFFYLCRGLWVQRSFYRPLLSFLNTIEQDAMTEVSLPSSYQEWRIFEETYNKALSKIREYSEELQEFNQKLGQRVKERAAELAQANIEIRKLNEQLKDENRHMQTEMELARRIQTSLLPTQVNDIHVDFQIAATMLPAEEVGGDYYDITLDREGNLWFGIGDVSGHGVTPGLIMMIAQTVHTTITTHYHADPKDVVIGVNKVLYSNVHDRLQADHFMTFTTLKYLGNGRFQHAGAHLSLVIYRKKQKTCELIETTGTWLNFLPDISHVTRNSEFTLEIGDVMVLYTDGLTEVWNREEQMLDIQGFIDIVCSHIEKETRALRDAIITDVMAWCDHIRSDDMSLVVVRRIA